MRKPWIIFLLEENKTEAMYIKLSLQKVKGVEIRFFQNPDSLFEALGQRPDVVICDAQFEGESSVGLIAKIQRLLINCRIVVHASTNHYLLEEMQRLGVYKFLVKTEQSHELLRSTLEDLCVLIAHEEEARRKDA